MENEKLKYGRVVIVGRPNTGKSTLLNAIMNQKVAITSHMPQTTRKNMRVVYSGELGKLVISDTPGIIQKVEDLVSRRVNTEAPKEVGRGDVIICMLDISRPKSEEENKVLGIVRKARGKKILVYNKIDVAFGSKDHLPEYNYLEDEFDEVIAVSALKEKNVKGLIKKIFGLLPDTPDKEIMEEIQILTNQDRPVMSLSSKEYIAELIREKAYLFLREEVPYSTNVEVTEIKEKKDMLVVKAVLFTNDERYKKMIIGANGQKIKEIGYNARKELELMAARKVYLELTVEVDRHWAERDVNIG